MAVKEEKKDVDWFVGLLGLFVYASRPFHWGWRRGVQKNALETNKEEGARETECERGQNNLKISQSIMCSLLFALRIRISHEIGVGLQ